MGFSLKSNNNYLLYFLTTDVAEVFIAYIQLSYYVANQITLIFIYCQIFIFLSAGLYVFEYAYLKIVIIATIFFWVLFVFALNSFIFPTS